MNVRTVCVDKVNWYTQPLGQITPVLVLDKMYKTKSVEFDAITLNSTDIIDTLKIGKGRKIKIKVSSNKLKILEKSVNPEVKIRKFPTKVKNCPSCKEEAVDNKCANDWCIGKPRTACYRAIKYAIPNTTMDAMKKYLNEFKFTLDESPVVIQTFSEFLWAFDKIKENVNTTSRAGCLPHGNLARFEATILEKLKAGFTNAEFWSLMGLKNLDEPTLHKLSEVDYRYFLGLGEIDKQLRNVFEEEFENIPIIQDILFSEQSTRRIVKMLVQFMKYADNKEEI